MRSWPLIGLALLAAGCGDSFPLPGSGGGTCGTSMAIVAEGDGYLEAVCGCQEPNGTIVVPPATLTCTVTAGTTVVFQYTSVHNTRRVISLGSPAFAPGPASIPTAPMPLKVQPIEFPASGTYQFGDEYRPDLAGQIVVL